MKFLIVLVILCLSVSVLVSTEIACRGEHRKWYDCKPCRKLICGDSNPFFCLKLINICHSSGCYCEPGYLWHPRIERCVLEADCFKYGKHPPKSNGNSAEAKYVNMAETGSDVNCENDDKFVETTNENSPMKGGYYDYTKNTETKNNNVNEMSENDKPKINLANYIPDQITPNYYDQAVDLGGYKTETGQISDNYNDKWADLGDNYNNNPEQNANSPNHYDEFADGDNYSNNPGQNTVTYYDTTADFGGNFNNNKYPREISENYYSREAEHDGSYIRNPGNKLINNVF